MVEIVGIVQETVDAFLEKPLLLGQIKIHVLSLDYKSHSNAADVRRWFLSSLSPLAGRGIAAFAAVLKNAEAELRLCHIADVIRVRGYRTHRHFQCSRIEAPHPNPLPARAGRGAKRSQPQHAW